MTIRGVLCTRWALTLAVAPVSTSSLDQAQWGLPQTPSLVATDQRGALPDMGTLREIRFETHEGTWMNLDVSPDGRTIAFELLGSIYIMAIGGGEARQLTKGPAFDEHPQYTRNGRYIVFSSDRTGRVKLWRVPARGGTPTLVPRSKAAGFQVMPELDEAPLQRDTGTVWSPDGRIGVRTSATTDTAEMRVFDGCAGTMPKSFVLVARAAQRQAPLASAGDDCGDDVMPHSAFTPDGRAFITSYGGQFQRIEIPSGRTTVIPFHARVTVRVRPLVLFHHPISDDPVVHVRRIEHARLSPDGKHLTFTALNHVWVTTLLRETGRAPRPGGPAVDEPRRLTSLPMGEFEPTWSPDGQYVTFVSWTDDRGGEGAVYRVRADGTGPPERLTLEPGHYTDPAYTPDGKRLVAALHATRVYRRTIGTIDAHTQATDDELISIPAMGGAAVSQAMLEPIPSVESGFEFAAYGTLYFSHRVPGSVLRYRKDTRVQWRYNMGAVLGAPLGAALATADTVLRVTVSIPDTNGVVPNIYDVVLSPLGDRALVLANFRELYLVNVPPHRAGVVPSVTVGRHTSGWRKITSLVEGAEFPSWCADGRSFTYTFGHTVYVYDVARADSLVRDSVARAAAGGSSVGIAYRPMTVSIDVTAPRDVPTGTIAFRNARLITMRGDEVIEQGDIVVRDRRIVAIGPSGTVTVPPSARVVDVSGTTILPGFVDLHNHILPAPTVHHSRVWQFEANLAYGVLACRDPQANLLDFMTHEDMIATGAMTGPRYRNTGPGIGETDGDGIHSLTEARAIVQRYADTYQVQFLKEYGAKYRDAREWLVVAAAERNLNVTSHGHRRLKHLIANAIDGYGGYEHPVYTAPLYADVRQLLVATGITLAHSNWQWTGVDGYFSQTLTAADTARLLDWFPPTFAALQLRAWQHYRDKGVISAYNVWKMDSTLAQLVTDGGHLSVSDHGQLPGLGTHLQLWAYAKGGMRPLDILRAGTLRGAQALGLDGDLGALDVGKLADLVVLDANPLEDIHNTIRLKYVLLNGRLYDAGTLDVLWPIPRSMPVPWWRESIGQLGVR